MKKLMKGILATAILTLAGAALFAENTVAVLEFETKDADLKSKMPILTDIFRSELANTDAINVVDRANTDKALAEIALLLVLLPFLMMTWKQKQPIPPTRKKLTAVP